MIALSYCKNNKMKKLSLVDVYFLDLLKIAVNGTGSLIGIPSSDEWKEIYKITKQQTLLGFLFPAIELLPKDQRPPRPLLMQWFATAETIKEQNSKINQDAVEICDHIRKDNQRCVVLKGQGIATYYPDSSLRTPGDIDLWIEGGTKKVLNYLRSKGEVTSITYKHVDFDVPISTEVELHHNPSYFYNPLYTWRFKQYAKKQNELFENYVELPEQIGKIFVPTVEFNRFYILQHIYCHYFGEGVGLRQFLDYYYVLRKGGSDESKQRTLNLFKKTGMMKFVGATMWVLQEVFGMEDNFLLCTPNEKDGQKLLNEIMLSGNFGKYDNRFNRKNHHKLLPRVWNSVKRKVRFVIDYPQEILFDIPMRTYIYIWKYFV